MVLHNCHWHRCCYHQNSCTTVSTWCDAVRIKTLLSRQSLSLRNSMILSLLRFPRRPVMSNAITGCMTELPLLTTGWPLFFNYDFPWLFHDQKMNFHDLSAQHIFFEINYLWMLNRIKIFPVARHNYCHKIKPQVYVHVFTSISMLQNSLSNTTSLTALEILQLLLHFPWLSTTLAVFLDFPGLENGLTKFHDFPGRVNTL